MNPKSSEEAQNLVQIFLSRVARYGNRPALYYKQGKDFVFWTWNQWADHVRRVALGLYQLGVRHGDRVALLSENRPEWTFADLGILSLGAVTVPLYVNCSLEDATYILEHAEVKHIFLSTRNHYERLRDAFTRLPEIQKIIVFDGCLLEARLLAFEELLERGRLEDLNNGRRYGQLVDQVRPQDTATIIYTSGTTGPPKGVQLSHHNFVANYLGARERIQVNEQDRSLSFLPLSHVFERLAGYYFMVFQGACIAYAENMQTVPEDLLHVRPTVAASVPRLYEKMHARILEVVHASGGLRKRIFGWAIAIGTQVAHQKQQKRSLSLALRLCHWLANALVFKKLRARLGGRIRFFISGGAPLARELAEFFYAAGILILEGYGLTETSPVIAVNSPEEFKFGTVGKPLPNVEVKIAEDGEILTRGPCVMQGYYKNPEATAEAMAGGWFHTGDIGRLDEEGYLSITDRKKEIIVTSGGKNISPQNIEKLITGDPLFLQVVVIGDRRNYLVALIVPDRSMVEDYAKTQGITAASYEELLEHPEVYRWVENRLHQRTHHLASFEQVKYFSLLAKELSVEGGELTPTLKVKRKVVAAKYHDRIEALYEKGKAWAQRTEHLSSSLTGQKLSPESCSPQGDSGFFYAVDQCRLFYRYESALEAEADILVILHGHGEHSGRYQKFRKKLQGMNVSVASFDLRGNGHSEGRRVYVESFEEYLEDLSRFRAFLESRYGIKKKIILLGHSLGGLIAVRWASRYPEKIKGLILSSPCLGLRLPSWVVSLNRFLNTWLPRWIYTNPVYPPHLTHNPEEVANYKTDAFIQRKISVRLLQEMLVTTQQVQQQPVFEFPFPVYILMAGLEKVVDGEMTRRFYERLQAPEKDLICFESFYHEIFNEIEQDRAFTALRDCIQKIRCFSARGGA